MKLLIDTNVLLDSLLSRQPFADKADLLMELGAAKEFDLYMSVSQFTDAAYILSEGGRKPQLAIARNALQRARKAVHIATLDESDVDAVLASNWTDLEDALVYRAARSARTDAIITRNQQDFAKSSIPVFDCDEFFAWMKKTHGVEYALADF